MMWLISTKSVRQRWYVAIVMIWIAKQGGASSHSDQFDLAALGL